MCHDTETSGMTGGPMSPDPYYNVKNVDADETSGLQGAVASRPSSSAFHDAHRTAKRAAQQHAKAVEAIDFFTKHPEFDAFVSLVRSGAIQF